MGWADDLGRQGIKDGKDQGKHTSSPGPLCSDSKEQQQRLMGGLGQGVGNECIRLPGSDQDFSLITQQGKIRGGKIHTANKT